MKIQPRVLIFMIILYFILRLTSPYWESWFLAYFSIIISISVFFIGIVIFLENRDPSKTITWLIVLAVFPVIGFFFYILFGRNYRKRKMFRKKAKEVDKFRYIEQYLPLSLENYLEQVPQHQRRFFHLANTIGDSPISFQTETKVLTNGEETFSAIIEALKQAKHHIHLEYYIVRDDQIGNKIKEILVAKAKEGVEVRFIYDSVGCFNKLSKNYLKELKEAGVQVEAFFPVTFPLLNSKINFRNHRKIIIIDGEIGFCGGLNIGDEYLGKDPFFGHWRDTHLKVEKEGVRALQQIFLLDWFYITNEKILDPRYFSPTLPELPAVETGGVQIIASGPDQEWEVIKKLFFSMISTAQKTVYIASPYFIPDEDILSALKIAALSGIDVRLIVPSKPDHKIVFWATRSYFTELLEAGVKIYLYRKGFLHSKVIVVDEELASIGSANMDMRSFHLNFEVNAFLYRNESVRKLVSDFKQDFLDSEEVDLERFRQRKFLHRVYESWCKLFSPLL